MAEINVNEMIDGYVAKAQKALNEFMALNQEQIDAIVKAMTLAGLDKHMELAKMAVEETGRGVYEDKITKNMFATEYVYHSIKNEKTVGVIAENDLEDYEIIAEPVGVVCGVTPVTNPTSTTMFKALISVKSRNPIIFGFHPGAQKCSAAAAKIVLDAAVAAGAPENCIQWIEYPSIEATNALMKNNILILQAIQVLQQAAAEWLRRHTQQVSLHLASVRVTYLATFIRVLTLNKRLTTLSFQKHSTTV